MLPALVVPALQQQLAHSRRLHALDLAEGYGAVELPDALRANTQRRRMPGHGSTSFPPRNALVIPADVRLCEEGRGVFKVVFLEVEEDHSAASYRCASA
jgi:hypothetical protein